MPTSMRHRTHLVKLATVTAVLVSLALLNLYALMTPIETAPIAPAPARDGDRKTATDPVSLSGRRTDPSFLRDLTGRPIFHQDRKPAPREVAATPSAVESGPAGFELVGLMEGDDGIRRAMIRSGEQPAGWIGKGEQINGWQVTSIDSDQVTIEALGQRTSLKLYGRP